MTVHLLPELGPCTSIENKDFQLDFCSFLQYILLSAGEVN